MPTLNFIFNVRLYSTREKYAARKFAASDVALVTYAPFDIDSIATTSVSCLIMSISFISRDRCTARVRILVGRNRWRDEIAQMLQRESPNGGKQEVFLRYEAVCLTNNTQKSSFASSVMFPPAIVRSIVLR